MQCISFSAGQLEKAERGYAATAANGASKS
jgi:hypothetical protein